MDKIKTIKIKNPNGSVSEETYTIAVDAKNVDMENGKELQETIGTINIDNDGDISNQLKNLKSNKINKIDIIDNLESNDKNKVLSANQGKEINDKLKKKPYYYNSVADMKADAKLKAGDMAVTLGYYSANDGGGAEYIISTELNPNAYVEESHGIYIELLSKDIINILQVGCKNDNSEDISIIINQLMNKFNTIYIPSGNYKLTNPILIKNNIKIIGENIQTTIMNCDNIGFKLNEDSVNNFELSDLTFKGNTQYDLIQLIRENKLSFPTNSYIHDLFLVDGLSGINLGFNIVGNLFNNIYCKNCKYGLFLLNSTDNVFNNIECEKCENGINGTTYSSYFNNIKCWTCYGDGIIINAGRNYLINVEVQECVGHGFNFTTGNVLHCINCNSDRVGTDSNFQTPAELTKYNYYINNLSELTLVGSANDFRAGTLGASEKGILYASNLTNVDINLLTKINNVDKLTINGSLFNNYIKIDGKYYANSSTETIVSSTNGTIGKRIEAPSSNMIIEQILNTTNNSYYHQIYDNNNNYVGRPFRYDNEANISIGSYEKKVGFFGSAGSIKQTAINDASDLDSCIKLTNNIKKILHDYNLM